MELLDRYSWQNKTLFDLKRESGLLDYSLFNQSKTDYRYVVIFGYPQSGKTEIVLALIGIKGEYLQHVYSILRAKQAVSHSSTSTAIMYHRMDSSRFEWGLYKEYVGENKRTNVGYFTEEAFGCELRKIRQSVETGKEEYYKHKILLHICIPLKYFTQAEDSFDVVDFPGIESTNIEESRYVRNLADRFIPLATKILLVCNAYQVTQLQTIKIPGLENLAWSELPYRFLVIPTCAYTSQQEECLEAFKQNPQRFTEVCIENCRNAAMCCIKTSEKIDIEPLEVGETLRNLERPEYTYWHVAGLPDLFYSSIRRANNQVLERIRNTIADSEFYQPLQERISFQRLIKKQFEMNVKNFDDEIVFNNDIIGEKRKNLLYLEEIKEKTSDKVNELKEKLKIINSTNDKIKKYDFESKLKEVEDDRIIYDWLTSKINRVYEYDSDSKNRELIESLFGYSSFKRVVDKLQELYELEDGVQFSFKKFKVDSALANKCRELFKKGFFFGFTRKNKDEVCGYIEEYVLEATRSWYEGTIQAYENKYSELKSAYTTKIKSVTDKLKNEENQIININESIDLYVKRNLDLKKQKNEEELSFKNTEAIFERWKEFAIDNFLMQRKHIIKLIKEEKSSAGKTNLFLSLCVITQDFEDVMKG